MPEVIVTERMKSEGGSLEDFRLLATFVAAMDRARDADRLWFSGLELWRDKPWAFDPAAVVSRTFTELSDALIKHGVSQRHLADSGAWRRIAEAITMRETSPAVYDVIHEGRGTAEELLVALAGRTGAGTSLFPFLSGPKVGPMWVRMLAHPGGAHIENIEIIPVAVDTQVRKVSEFLGVTQTFGKQLESVRGEIQDTWAHDVKINGAQGPDPISGTAAALDPALWFFGKWGCTHCERAGEPRAIHTLCRKCRFVELRGE